MPDSAKPAEPEAYLFSPIEAREERYAALRSEGYRSRRKANPQKCSRGQYTKDGYAARIGKACERAFPPPAELARQKVPSKHGLRWETPEEWKARLGDRWAELVAWRQAHHWHPNQLRHTHLTAVRKQHGLEAAQVAAGHAKADVTQIYAERDLNLAIEVAKKMG